MMTIKNAFVVFAACSLVACGAEPKKDGTPKLTGPRAGAACTDRGATACDGTATVLSCNGTQWSVAQNCTGTRQCGEATAGVFSCVQAPGSCQQFSPADYLSIWDPDFRNYAQQLVFNTEQNGVLQIENWPTYQGGVQPGQSATVAIEGPQTNYNDCGLCILMETGNAQGELDGVYFAHQGSVDVSMPATTGGDFVVTLNNVKLRELDPQTGEPLANGRCFDLPNVTFGQAVPTTRWPCLLIGGQEFVAGQEICAMSQDRSQQEIWACGTDNTVTRTQDCDATGLTCENSPDQTNAVCQ